MRHLLAFSLLLAALAPARTARAEADPFLGYVYGSLAAPWQLSVSAQKEEGWQTSTQLGRRVRSDGSAFPTTLGAVLDGAQLGAGIGYDGWNVQLDIGNAHELAAGVLGFGRRERLQLGHFELWGRLAAGPAVIIDYGGRTLQRSATGGLVVTAEAGADYLLLGDRLAVGVRAMGLPQYTFPSRFACDFGLNLGVRLLL